MGALYFFERHARGPRVPFYAHCTNLHLFFAKSLCKLTNKKFPKPLDKWARLWYNISVR